MKHDPAALFLLDLHWPNLFEPQANGQFRCKLCDAVVALHHRKSHHQHHTDNRPKPERKEATEMAAKKTQKITARDQGFPEVYLGEGGNFKPGYDARAKTDLIHAAEGWDNPSALHKFSPEEAASLIAKRHWNGHRLKSREAREAKLAREAKRKAEKVTAAKKRATAKKETARKVEPKTTNEVTPDPKPVKRQPRRRSS